MRPHTVQADPRFTSHRERLLWAAALVVVAIVFNATAAVTAVGLGAAVRWIVRRRENQPR